MLGTHPIDGGPDRDLSYVYVLNSLAAFPSSFPCKVLEFLAEACTNALWETIRGLLKAMRYISDEYTQKNYDREFKLL